MKARYIRRLRNVVAKFEMYIVIPSRGLFGEFCPLTEGKTNLHYFKAESPVRAIRRYQRCISESTRNIISMRSILRLLKLLMNGVSSRWLI